jgi:translation initiation factor 2B subunit (eIF-2B alpha/beta/delta family)
MAIIPADIQAAIDAIASDRESGASHLLAQARGVLRRALSGVAPVRDVARAVHLAQPSMAGLLNAAAEAVASRHEPERFERFVQRLERSPAALARWGVTAFDDSADPVHIVTISSSQSVLAVLSELAKRRPLHVSCAEGRPALEGRALAAQLRRLGIEVTFFTDAAIATALDDAQAVLIGADSVAPSWFLNKIGTRMLCAAAAFDGRPVYIAATREKFVRESASHRLVVREGPAPDVWADPAAGVVVRNPYFESTPLDLVTALITDAGVLGAGMAADVCAAAPDDRWLDEAPLPAKGTTQLP